MRNKYCAVCGGKNVKVPMMFLGHNKYDSETGKQIFEHICNNSSCPRSKNEMKQHTIDSCPNHKQGINFLESLFFWKEDRCKYCGQPSFVSEGMGWN